MYNSSRLESRTKVLAFLFVFAIIATLFALPSQFVSRAGGGSGLVERTVSHDSGLPNYDIRSDKRAFDRVAAFRNSQGFSAAAVADVRENFARGEQTLKSRVPTLTVEYNPDIRIPEVIAPDVKQGRAFLTSATGGRRSDALKNFLKQNSELTGTTVDQIDGLKVFSDYTNPDGNLSFVELNQEIDGIPVFHGEIKAGFTKNGEIIRVINNLAPGLAYESLSTNFHNPLDAVKAAAVHIEYNPKGEDLARNDAASDDLKTVFGNGDWATTAEKMYFPTEPGVAVPAWRVLIWQPVNAYYVIVDAESGTLLWRKNITEDQTQAATYQVYTNSNAMINSADSPAPLTPGPISPLTGTQGPLLARTNITRVGNEAPYSFNDTGWITDGLNVTDGNANEAGLDRVAPNGVDAAQAGSPNRVFDSTWNPPPGSPSPGDTPLIAAAQRGAVIQMFYVMNLYHDELYRLGFTEQARNFQQNNFGRGGLDNDRISSEGQDISGTDNANFSTPADSGRGRMQMFIFTGADPDRDGTTDVDVIIHEVTHGTSNRLHGNGSGLSSNMSRGMGEGWSDFYAHAMLSEPGDPINGIYTTGGYVLAAPFNSANFYYGIRRFPKAVIAFTGGPSNRPHNPLTFADIDGLQINIGDGAFSPSGGGMADQGHNAGEVWSSALWEARARLITVAGDAAAGNRRTLQLVTDGMKLAPLNPTFLQERDAIISGALAGGTGAEVAAIWAGFAARGMGFSASIQNIGTGGSDARVTQSFDLPNLVQTPSITVSDTPGDNDGFPEPGEPVSVNFPLTNTTGNPANNVIVQIVGGGSANYGTIANGATQTQPIPYTVPAAAACGSSITLTFNVSSSLGSTSFTRTIIVGSPQVTFTQNFDGVTAPAFPAGWTVTSRYAPITFVTRTTAPQSAPNSGFAADFPTGTTAPVTDGGDTDLTSPVMPITAQAAIVTFSHRFNTEPGWDGGVLELSIGGGGFQDLIAAGGQFISNGYNGAMGVSQPNPLGGRAGWTGESAGYITSVAQLPASAAGQNVQLRWRFGTDNNTAPIGGGWDVDSVSVAGNYACSFSPSTVRSRADFDGDGRTDISVFRPSDGIWYLNESTAGFTGIAWGLNGDVPVPGDFDADGRADTAVFRANDGPGVDFYVLASNGFVFNAFAWGSTGDLPVVGDYDNDNRSDVAIFRPSDGTWYVLLATGGLQINGFGQFGDIPVAGDFDGDGRADRTVFRNGTWISQLSGGGIRTTAWGLASDRIVPADYDGDNIDDLAVFRPSNGAWFVLRSTNGGIDINSFGQNGDVPVPGDYDGDGRDDLAVYRGGIWFINRSSSGLAIESFGLQTDIPVPSRYLP